MPVYRDHVLPRIVDLLCRGEQSQRARSRVCGRLGGHVVEVGFGSGLNVPFYPSAITRVAAVEPADVAWDLAAPRIRASTVPVERAALDAQALPFPEGTFDAALSTWTMCTIPDAGAALRELRRVLKPAGALHFVEHGLAPDPPVRRWQYRLDPLQQRLFGGCHLTRPVADLVRGAGFEIADLDVYYEPGSPRILGATTLGTARPA